MNPETNECSFQTPWSAEIYDLLRETSHALACVTLLARIHSPDSETVKDIEDILTRVRKAQEDGIGRVGMGLWWVSWEEWESGECHSTRWTRALVAAGSAERAVQIVLDAGEPNWMGDAPFDRPEASVFVMPCGEGVVRWGKKR